MKYKLINKKAFTLALATTISTQVVPVYSFNEDLNETQKTEEFILNEPVTYELEDFTDVQQVNEVSTYDTSAIDEAKKLNTLDYHTQQQIADKYDELNIANANTMTFETEPDFTNGTYGKLSNNTLQDALNVFNYIRYVVGLSSDVQLSEDYNNKSQAMSFVLASYGKGLSHSLDSLTNSDGSVYKPTGMSDDDYKLADDGSSSNLSAGRSTLTNSLVAGWMSDSDDNNIARVGHRINMLSPTIQETGFGYAYNNSALYKHYTANYVWDAAFAPTDIESIAWPSRNIPTNLFANDDPWSYSSIYSAHPNYGGSSDIDVNNVKVVLEKLNNDGSVNKTWEFDSNNKSENYTSSNGLK